MRGRSIYLCLAAFLLIATLIGTVNAEYWFQFGARAGVVGNQNNGAAITIQTIAPQFSQSGSLGYWVGENLDNGAFLQIGYVIENQSGIYPSKCDMSGCSAYKQINAGDAQWFYEYFPSGYNGGFLGQLGPDGSAGTNGTFNRYAFYYSGNKWYFAFNGNIIGNVSLGSSTSGVSVPVAFGEVANTTGITNQLPNVIFANFSIYKSGHFTPLAQGLSYIGYGVGSRTDIKNPYGVVEIGNRVNYFEVGSGLAQTNNNTQLWNLGYNLKIVSSYANITNTTNYIAYSNVRLSSPQSIQLNSTTREFFTGWQGAGLGSYTGPANSTLVELNGNVTETAMWQRQYYLNITSQYGSTSGSGWYFNNSVVDYGIAGRISSLSAASRENFTEWSNGNTNATGTVIVTKPTQINAQWSQQYLVNVITQYGNATGGGWYNNNSTVRISLDSEPVEINSTTQLGFFEWSNGNANASFYTKLTGPLVLSAQFRSMYLTVLAPQSQEGNALNDVIFYIGNGPVASSTYLFSAVNYQISYAYYKGVKMTVNYNFSVSSPGVVAITLPIYNVDVAARDIFGAPVNSLALLEFSNGTKISTYTGSNGTIVFRNVPYGFVNGTLTYLWISESLSARNGNGIGALFVSAFNIGVFALVVVAIIVAFFVSRHHFGNNNQPAQPQL
ncbi:MAG: hypothetical protein ACREBF_01370 [Candidatus Micrarchaeales archaeon]